MVSIPIQLQKENINFLLVAQKEKYPIEKEWQENNNYKFDSAKLLIVKYIFYNIKKLI
jgi:hypothetical protein